MILDCKLLNKLIYSINEMILGKVKLFDDNKGTGIIKDNFGREYYVYYKDIKSEGYLSIESGTKVKFETAAHKSSGRKAINVKIME